jgi:hypothetical protein
MSMTRVYSGRCHCGAVRFRFRSETITTGCRCNCSICIRRGATMSSHYVPPSDFEALDGLGSLAVYRFGDYDVNHYFCRSCGIYPFHDCVAKPGHYRINLGCIDGLDTLSLEVRVIDGRSF